MAHTAAAATGRFFNCDGLADGPNLLMRGVRLPSSCRVESPGFRAGSTTSLTYSTAWCAINIITSTTAAAAATELQQQQ
jgi:hypothetical protein